MTWPGRSRARSDPSGRQWDAPVKRVLDQELLREAFRYADFALNHLAGGEELADAWSRAELLNHEEPKSTK